MQLGQPQAAFANRTEASVGLVIRHDIALLVVICYYLFNLCNLLILNRKYFLLSVEMCYFQLLPINGVVKRRRFYSPIR